MLIDEGVQGLFEAACATWHMVTAIMLKQLHMSGVKRFIYQLLRPLWLHKCVPAASQEKTGQCRLVLPQEARHLVIIRKEGTNLRVHSWA